VASTSLAEKAKQQTFLRLYSGEEEREAPSVEVGSPYHCPRCHRNVEVSADFDDPQLTCGCGHTFRVEPKLMWPLSKFFERWFLKGVLKPKGAAAGTIDLYGDALRYWTAITGDPPLWLISDEHGIDFVAQLPEWGYSRAGVHRGGKLRIGLRSESPGLRPLASTTIAEHVGRITTVLQAAGPRFSCKQCTAEVLSRFPYVPPYAGQFVEKSPWTVAQVRQIARGCLWMDKPALPEWLTHELWWKVRLALFYYTGFRAGTVVALAWSHIREEHGAWSLEVPGEVVTKTRKAAKLALHPQLVELLQQLREARARVAHHDSDLILPAGCGYRYFLDLHVALQEAAGLPEAQHQSPHGWRRTHLAEIDRLGAKYGEEAARLAGQHATARTTAEFYVGQAVLNELRMRMPPLFAD
jgi:hypothetical protein